MLQAVHINYDRSPYCIKRPKLLNNTSVQNAGVPVQVVLSAQRHSFPKPPTGSTNDRSGLPSAILVWRLRLHVGAVWIAVRLIALLQHDCCQRQLSLPMRLNAIHVMTHGLCQEIVCLPHGIISVTAVEKQRLIGASLVLSLAPHRQKLTRVEREPLVFTVLDQLLTSPP